MIWNTISAIPTALLFVIGALSLYLNDPYLYVTTVGALIVVVFVAVLKLLSIPYMSAYPWLQRPKGAKGCDCFEDKKTIKPGFPSGHAALITFLVVMLIWKYTSQETIPLLVCLGSMLIASVGISRMQLNCHTYTQVWAGQIVGLLSACCLIYLE